MQSLIKLETVCNTMGVELERAKRVLRSSGVPVRTDGGVNYVKEEDMVRIRLILAKAKVYSGGFNTIATEPVEIQPIRNVLTDVVFMRDGAEIKGVVCGGVERRKIAVVRWRDRNGFKNTTEVYFKDILATEDELMDMVLFAKRRGIV